MKNIIFITGNEYKYVQAKEALKETDIKLIRQDIDTPEIQSTKVEDIASYSSKWASTKLNQPVVLTDAGYYFEALNGFPGPFIKYINQWFTAQDYLNLMAGKTNRRVIITQCLSYCEPGQDPVNFLGSVEGTIANYVGSIGKWKTPINQVYIPQGYDKVVGELPFEEMMKDWNSDTVWSQFVEYLSNHSTSSGNNRISPS